MLEFYFDLNYLIYQHALALDVIQVIDGKILAKVNSVPCKCSNPPRQRVDD